MDGADHTLAGRYRLEDRIGSGAMGIVWRATDELLSRTVAVKQLLLPPGMDAEEAEEATLRAMREGRIAARLHHPNAITVFDVVQSHGVPWLVMEYLPSQSLAALVHERGPLEPREVAKIGYQVAAALAAAHEAGIVHRDIKPGNVLIGPGGAVKITDFGISRATGDATLTKTGMLSGTPAYLAPEVADGAEPGMPSDVFSLGSTLYAAVEGVPPFGLNENTFALLRAVAACEVRKPERAGELDDLLACLLTRDPNARPTAAEALPMLEAIAGGSRPKIVAVPNWTSPQAVEEKTLRRRRAGVIMVAAAFAAVVGALVTALLVINQRQEATAGPPDQTRTITYGPSSGAGVSGSSGATGTPTAPAKMTTLPGGIVVPVPTDEDEPPAPGPPQPNQSTQPSQPTTTPETPRNRLIKDAVRQFYELLPANTVAAHQRFAPATRPTLAAFQAQWADVESVRIQRGMRVTGDAVHLTLKIKKKGATAVSTAYVVSVVVTGTQVQIGTIKQGGSGGEGP
ncbi:serine/threonine protein kinase [Allokutzneria sp. A3M-2-11 16]|uniref:serine/threonine-protein kinase n=1 Tax=Allokutzneria sp. A3M-2-11 16 TaxID=2962043 RepID=UPI0020B684B5|nr:serine/threonine-protein kinase [Allokutzneria sp. A3M-2-11 16]MCP3798801.1 serine/threonine protein kinase [Allokutzneria sp. A3M-2-11 16]